jgi:hypothetical protein
MEVGGRLMEFDKAIEALEDLVRRLKAHRDQHQMDHEDYVVYCEQNGDPEPSLPPLPKVFFQVRDHDGCRKLAELNFSLGSVPFGTADDGTIYICDKPHKQIVEAYAFTIELEG